jgi:hypothetical protein
MLFKKIVVKEHTRAIVVRNGRVRDILRPGTHLLLALPFQTLHVECHKLHRSHLRSRWLDRILNENSELAREHLTVVTSGPAHMALVSIDGALYKVLLPGQREVFWKDAGRITVERVNIVETPEISDRMLGALEDQEPVRRSYSDRYADSEELLIQSALGYDRPVEDT